MDNPARPPCPTRPDRPIPSDRKRRMAVTDTDQEQTSPGETPAGPERPSGAAEARAGAVRFWRSAIAPAAARAGGYLGLVEPVRRPRPGAADRRGPPDGDATDRMDTVAPRPAPGAKPGGRDLKGTPIAAAGATVASAAAGLAASAASARDRAVERQRARAERQPSTPPPLEYAPTTAVVEDRRQLGSVVRARVRTASFSVVGLVVTGGIVALVTALVAQTTAPRAAAEAAESVDAEIVLPDQVSLSALEARSVVYGSDGTVLDVIDREVNRSVIDFESIPQHVRQAFVAAEDRRFYEHDGYDVEGIGRAVVANFEAGSIEQGGSTITQQLAKDAVGSEESLDRKIDELTYAMRLEEEYSKDELLEQYLNQVYFGERSYGIAGAAEEFFAKPHTELSVEEAALLAGMVRNPTATDPRREPETATFRRDSVLAAMAEEGYIDPATLEERQAQPLGVAEPTSTETELPFVVDSAYREFLYSPEFAQWGDTVEERQDAFFKGGLHIHVSIDSRLQALALEVLQDNYPVTDGSRPTGAIAAVEPASGRILAAQSPLSYTEEQFDIATQGRRQPGSTYKPFIYAEALQQGFPTSMTLDGSSPKFFPNSGGWEREEGGVENYGGRSYGSMQMPEALARSVNTAAVQLSQIVGVENVVDLTSRMGVNNDAALNGGDGNRIVNPSLVLGGLEQGVTPLEMASAYSTFANNGTHVRPHMIDYITDRAGNPLYTSEPARMATQVLDSDVNATMVDMMRGVVTGGTGRRAAIPGWPVAGKTGTTNGNRDAWFVGYTPTLAASSWMGYENANRPTGQDGGGLPTSVWRQFMSRALEGQASEDYNATDAVAPDSLPSGQPTTVPDVRRMGEGEGLQALVQAGLTAEFRPTSSEAAAGTILWQDPDPGTDAATGDSVMIGISTGPAPRTPEGDDDDDESAGGGGGGGGGADSDDAEEETSVDAEEDTSVDAEEPVLDSQDG